MAELKREEIFFLSHLGYMLYKEGQYEKAISIFRGLSELEPATPEFHSMLATLYHISDNPQAALNEALQALEAKPNDVGSMITLGEVYLQLQQKNQALQVLNSAYQWARQLNHPGINRIYLLLQSNR